jgi:hypothetical protein
LLGSVMAASKPLVFTVTALPAIGALYSATGLISEVCVRSLSYFLIDCGLRLITFLSHLVSSCIFSSPTRFPMCSQTAASTTTPTPAAPPTPPAPQPPSPNNKPTT